MIPSIEIHNAEDGLCEIMAAISLSMGALENLEEVGDGKVPIMDIHNIRLTLRMAASRSEGIQEFLSQVSSGLHGEIVQEN